MCKVCGVVIYQSVALHGNGLVCACGSRIFLCLSFLALIMSADFSIKYEKVVCDGREGVIAHAKFIWRSECALVLGY